MRSGHVTVAEILEERILQLTAGDVTLSAATQHDAGHRDSAAPKYANKSKKNLLNKSAAVMMKI